MQICIVYNITIYLQSEFYMLPQITHQNKCKFALFTVLRFISRVSIVCLACPYLAVAVGLTIVKSGSRKLTEGLGI